MTSTNLDEIDKLNKDIFTKQEKIFQINTVINNNELIEFYIFNQLKEFIKNSINYLETKYTLHYDKVDNQNYSYESMSEFFKFLKEKLRPIIAHKKRENLPVYF